MAASRKLKWFFDHIEAGVTYANRPQGATTGAWPGFQPFGGWKGSGSTGKAGGSIYYVPQYMHEQIADDHREGVTVLASRKDFRLREVLLFMTR